MFHNKPIMGIVNVTPDSFSDGGDFYQTEQAVAHARQLIADGADILDIGGQSTRPGYQEIPPEEEAKRVIPVIEGIRRFATVPISVDTYFPEVARQALAAGADIINDIKGLDQPGMIDVIADYQCPVIIMHSRQRDKSLSVAEDIQRFYEEKMTLAAARGIKKEHICFDPGIGFHKAPEENVEILAHPEAFRYRDLPLLYGFSRKRTIARLTGNDAPKERDAGTLAASLFVKHKGVDIVRVHNVKATKEAFAVWQALD